MDSKTVNVQIIDEGVIAVTGSNDRMRNYIAAQYSYGFTEWVITGTLAILYGIKRNCIDALILDIKQIQNV